MKRYRSKVKGPLPVGLKSGSISVASKGYFNVDGDDLTSPDLLTKLRTKKIELIEEVVTVEVADDPPSPPETQVDPGELSVPEDAPEPSPDDDGDVVGDEKDDDSLTSSSEMVESDNEETGSGDADIAEEPKSKKKKKRKATGGKARTKKKGISG
jgi:hypothetical protein